MVNAILIIIAVKIIADANILFAKEAFSEFGDVVAIDGRDITNDTLKDAEMLIVRSITTVNQELLRGTHVRFVASATIGTDHVDCAFLKKCRIGFGHAPGSNAAAVAEYAISALVHLAQKMKLNISDMTVGIIGVGNVGSRVLKLCRALGMQCLLNDPPKKALTASDIYLPLKTVLRESDVVTLHVPLTSSGHDATYHLVNDDFISAMKKGAVLVNTSRGGVMDEKVFLALRERLGAVVLDVWGNEPAPDPDVIDAADIATPHIAGYSYDGRVYGTQMIYGAACEFFHKNKTWKPPSVAEQKKSHEIDLRKSDDPIFSAISAAYPIMKDDADFRKINEFSPDKRPRYFDGLRNNYPQRLEFRNFSVTTAKNTPDNYLSTLSQLGFKVMEQS